MQRRREIRKTGKTEERSERKVTVTQNAGGKSIKDEKTFQENAK